MTDREPGHELNTLIGRDVQAWSAHYQFHGKNAPGHRLISQLIALGVEAKDVRLVHGSTNSDRALDGFTLDVTVWTDTLVLELRSSGEGPATVTAHPRSELEQVRILSAPIMTFQQLGSEHEPLVVELKYPWATLELPNDRWNDDVEARLAAALPALLGDLHESG